MALAWQAHHSPHLHPRHPHLHHLLQDTKTESTDANLKSRTDMQHQKPEQRHADFYFSWYAEGSFPTAEKK